MIVSRWILSALALFASTAHAFIDPPVITPEHPTTQTSVLVSIQNGGCDALLRYELESHDDGIDVTFEKIPTQYPPLCINPVSVDEVELPLLAVGPHELRIYFHDNDPPGAPIVLWFETTLYIAPAGGVTPAPVPGIDGPIPVALLVLGLVLLASRYRRYVARLASLPVVLVWMALFAGAHVAGASVPIEVLLSADAGSPTVSEVIVWASTDHPGDAAPLSALRGTAFESVKSFIPEPERATGDLAERLREYPNSPYAMLERYLVVSYPDETDTRPILESLRRDPHVLATDLMEHYELQSAGLTSFGIGEFDESQADQWHLTQIHAPAAWNYNPGHALIALLDVGLQWDHPNLRAFSGSTFTGGNYLTVGSRDDAYPFVGGAPSIDDDVDEKKPVPATDPACDRGDGMMVPRYAGHGTHTSGLAAAHAVGPGDVTGVCQHCRVYMRKVAQYDCDTGFSPARVTTQIKQSVMFATVATAMQSGVQIVSMSISSSTANFCSDPNKKLRTACLVLDIAESRDVLFVAASGNYRTNIFFPASESRVVAAGGTFADNSFWDESPNCPYGTGQNAECGSNYTKTTGGPKQELVAGARDIISTFYTGAEWNPLIRCTDGMTDLGTAGDGVSRCTGTSMSTPIIAGVFGILRSTNPLVRVGDPLQSNPKGLRYVVASTTDRAQLGQSWDKKFGYGIPDAEAAIKVVLGHVATAVVRNRATPLFGFYGSNAKDYTYTTSPQKAVAFTTNQAGNYTPVGALVPGYPAFPPDPGLPTPPAPKAVAYVMTTPNKPNVYTPDLVPLYQMEISRRWPANCVTGAPGCNLNNRDFLLATDVSDLQAFKGAGYSYYGIEGYIYQRCTPESECIPEGAEKLWRKCNLTDDDCAVFLDRDYGAYDGNGYTETVPSGSNPVLGYAYPAVDTDGDGLVDGFEYVIGTRPETGMQDTDGDGLSDAYEFPMIGISRSDPCSGYPYNASRCPGDTIFENGFD